MLQKADMDFTDRLMQRMREEKIEFRRGSAGGGNQLRQPYLRDGLGISIKTFPMLIMSTFMGSILAISRVWSRRWFENSVKSSIRWSDVAAVENTLLHDLWSDLLGLT